MVWVVAWCVWCGLVCVCVCVVLPGCGLVCAWCGLVCVLVVAWCVRGVCVVCGGGYIGKCMQSPHCQR